MNDSYVDPFESDPIPSSAKPFAVGYKRANGEGLVYGAMLFAVGFLVLGLFGKAQILVSLSLIPIFIAYWFYPMIDRGQPQLGANKDGLFLERLGFLKWDAISAFELKKTSVRTIEVTKLSMKLNRPLEEAIAKPQVFPFWKAFMSRCWKVVKPAKDAQADAPVEILVDLHPLEADPEEIFTRLRRFRPV